MRALRARAREAGGRLVEITLQRASYAGRDPETGWLVHNHDLEDSIGGILVLKGAPDLVDTARSKGIHIEDEYDGAVLTPDPIGWPDLLHWKGKTYKVKDVDEKLDGSDLSFYVAKLALHKGEKEASYARARADTTYDARSETRTFLTTHLNDTNIVKEDGFTEAAHYVIYMNTPYPIIREFLNSSSPVDGLYAIGEPDSRPLIGASSTPYGYEVHVPIFIFTINKLGSGTKLKGRMETELRRVCETHRIEDRQIPRLERRGHSHKQRGSTIVYSTEFVLNYKTPALTKA